MPSSELQILVNLPFRVGDHTFVKRVESRNTLNDVRSGALNLGAGIVLYRQETEFGEFHQVAELSPAHNFVVVKQQEFYLI